MILLFGPTGAGKSMQGQMLAVRMGWKWLSTGQMLRESTDPEVIEVLKSGELVSDELTYEVFDAAIQDAKAHNYPKVIVDGFPRTKEQAEWLAEHMQKSGERIELVHRATSRDIFARGALHAAARLAGRPAGLYRVRDLLD